MYKILNRLAWLASLSLGFFLVILLFLLFEMNSDFQEGPFSFVLLFASVIFGALVKGVFLSEKFIQANIIEKGSEASVEKITSVARKPESGVSPMSVPEVYKPAEAMLKFSPPSVALKDKGSTAGSIVPAAREAGIAMSQTGSEPERNKGAATGNFFQKFFKEHALAKIGGIFLFLAVLFLLQLVYSAIGPIGKIMIGSLTAFAIFFSGVFLDKKGYAKEARVLIGTAILINYLVILSGRYLIQGEASDSSVLNEVTAFLLLILNTVFAIAVSIVYDSYVILFFSFIIAYLNPFLIGAQPQTEPFTVVIYSAVVSLGAIVLSRHYKDRSATYSDNLLSAAFVGGNILFLAAPVSDSVGWVIKLFSVFALSLFIIFTSYHRKKIFYTAGFYIGTYVFFLASILLGKSINDISQYYIFYGSVLGIFTFLSAAYYMSFKKGFEGLYLLCTLASITVLLPIIEREGDFRTASIAVIAFFWLFNVVLPFLNRNLFSGKANGVIFSLISCALFITGETYYFWTNVSERSTDVLGAFLMAYAWLYFLIGLGLNLKKKEFSEDARDTAIGLGLSFFSLSVAYIFSGQPSIISLVWIFESILLYYFYSKKGNYRIYSAASALMFLGVIRFAVTVNGFYGGEYGNFAPLVLALVASVLGLYFLHNEKDKIRNIHDLTHVFGVLAIGAGILRIIPNIGNGLDIFAISIYALVLALVYGSIYSAEIRKAYFGFLAILFFIHVIKIDPIFRYLESENLAFLKVLQYLATFSLVLGVYALRRISSFIGIYGNKKDDFDFALISALFVYLFVNTTQYAYYLFNENPFVITIYWGVLALVLLSFGIQKNLIRFRTAGLYVLSLTALKILLLDIWSGLDDAVMRVIALMVVGAIMIGISLLYSKKYKGDLKGEFELKNFKNAQSDETEKNIL